MGRRQDVRVDADILEICLAIQVLCLRRSRVPLTVSMLIPSLSRFMKISIPVCR